MHPTVASSGSVSLTTLPFFTSRLVACTLMQASSKAWSPSGSVESWWVIRIRVAPVCSALSSSSIGGSSSACRKSSSSSTTIMAQQAEAVGCSVALSTSCQVGMPHIFQHTHVCTCTLCTLQKPSAILPMVANVAPTVRNSCYVRGVLPPDHPRQMASAIAASCTCNEKGHVCTSR